MKKIIMGLTLVAFLTACTATKNTSTTASKTTEKSTAVVVNADKATLAKGKSIYEQNCAACHALKQPSEYTLPQWQHEVPKMVKMANKKAGSEVITAEKEALIIAYVASACKK